MSASVSLSHVQPPLAHAELRSIFDLPETPVIVRAFDFARERMPHALFNNETRFWSFATKVAAARADAFDAEVVAVSTLLHDMGPTPHGDGANRFEVDGASLAATQSISLCKETEVALSARGIGVDFGTADYYALDRADIDAVVAAVPRLDMKLEFAACALHLAETKPETTYDTFIREFGERYVPGYRAAVLGRCMAGGPFDE